MFISNKTFTSAECAASSTGAPTPSPRHHGGMLKKILPTCERTANSIVGLVEKLRAIDDTI
jgi:hypothetical protein